MRARAAPWLPSQLELLGHLPRALNIVGYGRSKVVLADFLEKQCVNVKEQPGLPKEEFMVSRGTRQTRTSAPAAPRALMATALGLTM